METPSNHENLPPSAELHAISTRAAVECQLNVFVLLRLFAPKPCALFEILNWSRCAWRGVATRSRLMMPTMRAGHLVSRILALCSSCSASATGEFPHIRFDFFLSPAGPRTNPRARVFFQLSIFVKERRAQLARRGLGAATARERPARPIGPCLLRQDGGRQDGCGSFWKAD